MKMHCPQLLIAALALLLGGCASTETIDMPGIGVIALLSPDDPPLEKEQTQALVRGETPKQIAALALLELRREYPDVKVENLRLINFWYRMGKNSNFPTVNEYSESARVTFEDVSEFEITGEEGDDILSRGRHYIIDFGMINGSNPYDKIYLLKSASSGRSNKVYLERWQAQLDAEAAEAAAATAAPAKRPFLARKR